MNTEEQLIKKRGKGKFNSSFKPKDIYNSYINNICKKELPLGTTFKDTSYDMNYDKYKRILKKLNSLIMLSLILENNLFIIPFRMGELSIKKRKTKVKLDSEGNLKKSRLPVDYKATKELWASDPKAKEDHIKIYILNDHFGNYRAFFHWKKKDINTKGIKPYSFIPTRDIKRRLAKEIHNNPNIEFYEV